MFERQPEYDKLQIFGSKAVVRKSEHVSKFVPTGETAMFIGYPETKSGYTFYIPSERKIVDSRDAKFTDQPFYAKNSENDQQTYLDIFSSNITPVVNQSSTHICHNSLPLHLMAEDCTDGIDDELQVEEENIEHVHPIATTSSVEPVLVEPITAPIDNRPVIEDRQTSDAQPTQQEAQPTSQEAQSTSNVQKEILNLTKEQFDDYVKQHPDQDIVPISGRPKKVTTENGRKVSAYRYQVNYINPRTIVQRHLSGPESGEWKMAMDDEIKSQHASKTWSLVKRPENAKVIDSMWVLTKKHEDGYIRFKARLVAKGFAQRSGIDYTETFAPVMRSSSIRLLLSLALNNDMFVHHVDIKTAYLNSKLDKVVYMRQPYLYEEGEDLVCQLHKAIYGLKQSARCWHRRLTGALKKNGFKHVRSDTCIYTNKKHNCIIAFYVDDLVIMSKDEKEIESIKKKLKSEFEITDKGRISTFLGISIERKEDSLHMSQTKYIEDLLADFGMSDCKPESIPTPSTFKFDKVDESPFMDDKQPYQSLVGSLIYLSNATRPDIQYTTGQLCRFMSCPKQAHFQAAKRVLKYLQGTKDHKLTYRKNPSRPYMQIYCDADYANGNDSKSISGVITFHRGNAIDWCSRAQQSVAASTCEAEVLAIKEGMQDAVYYRTLLCELTGVDDLDPVDMFNDNQSALRTIDNGGSFAANRHYITRINFIRDYVEGGHADLDYIPTKEMLADGLTKALPESTFNQMFQQFGITSG